MKTFKLKGLNYFVVGVSDVYRASIVCVKNKIGALPKNLEEFKGEIPKESVILKNE